MKTNLKLKERIDVSEISMIQFTHNKCHMLSNYCDIPIFAGIEVQ